MVVTAKAFAAKTNLEGKMCYEIKIKMIAAPSGGRNGMRVLKLLQLC